MVRNDQEPDSDNSDNSGKSRKSTNSDDSDNSDNSSSLCMYFLILEEGKEIGWGKS